MERVAHPISGNILAEHSGKDQHREWCTEYQVWLQPYDHIVEISGQRYIVNSRLLRS